MSNTSPVSPALPVERAGKGAAAPADVSGQAKVAQPDEDRALGRTGSPSAARRAEGEKWSAVRGLPISLLANPVWTRAEWAWRQILGQLLPSGPTHDLPATDDEPPAPRTGDTQPARSADLPPAGGPQLEAGQPVFPGEPGPSTMVLWKVLDELAADNLASDATVMWTGEVRAPLLALQTVRLEDFERQHPRVKQWILADRLQSAVQADDLPRTGSGLFFPDEWRIGTNEPGQTRRGIRWRAERWTKLSHGRLVHRLRIELASAPHRTQIDVIAAQPALYLHVATENKLLRQQMESRRNELEGALAELGWRLVRCTWGPYPEDGEEA